MEKYIFNENNDLWYELKGDYYIPCLSLPEGEERPIGLWGRRHLRYIKEYRKALYTSLWLSGKLNSYLADIDQQVQERLDTIIQQMAQTQGVTETLKAADPMTWVGRINNIQACAREIVDKEIIYAWQYLEAGICISASKFCKETVIQGKLKDSQVNGLIVESKHAILKISYIMEADTMYRDILSVIKIAANTKL